MILKKKLRPNVPIGTLISDDFNRTGPAVGSGWVVSGVDECFTISGNKLNIDDGSGTGNWNKSLHRSTYKTNFPRWKIQVTDFQLNFTSSSNTFGVGIGLKSVAFRTLAQRHTAFYLDTSTDATNGGKIHLVYIDVNTATVVVSSSSTIRKNLNDVFDITIERNFNVFTATYINKTNENQTVTLSYTFPLDLPTSYLPSNIGCVSFWSLGNNITTVDSVLFSAPDIYNEYDFVVCGDSIGEGYSALSLVDNYFGKAFGNTGYSVLNLSRQSMVVEDFTNTDALAELLSIRAKRGIIIQVGTNNCEHLTLSSYQAAIIILVNAIRAAGLVPIIMKLLPRNDAKDPRPFNSWIDTQYGSGGTAGFELKIINVYTPVWSGVGYGGNTIYFGNGGADTVHLSPAGYGICAPVIQNSLSSI